MYKYGYKHDWVTHQREFVKPGGIRTQVVEQGWNIKRSLNGGYRKTTKKWLQSYLNDFEWRYIHRNDPEKMFEILLRQVVST